MKRSLISTAAIILSVVLLVLVCPKGKADMEKPTEDAAKLVLQPQPKIKETGKARSGIEEKPQTMYYTEEEVVMVAKVLYRECRGVPSITEQACVAWTICNRVDDINDEFHGETVAEVVSYPNAFAYIEDTPVWEELYDLALDVLSRWNAERNGEVSVGRVLPADYTYFSGSEGRNIFRNAYRGEYEIWDYRLDSPYES